jgi:hypothetical protein
VVRRPPANRALDDALKQVDEPTLAQVHLRVQADARVGQAELAQALVRKRGKVAEPVRDVVADGPVVAVRVVFDFLDLEPAAGLEVSAARSAGECAAFGRGALADAPHLNAVSMTFFVSRSENMTCRMWM